MQWTSVICLSFSHSLGSGLSSTVHISGWASITWFWFLYLSYGPEEHANRSSKNNFGELIWMLARKRVILCSLGFLGAADYLHPHEKLVKRVNTEERYGEGERWEGMRGNRDDVIMMAFQTWIKSFLKTAPPLWICQLYKLTTSFAVWSTWERLLSPAPERVLINMTVMCNINSFHWTTTSFRSLRSALLNSISQDSAFHGLTP